MVTGGCDEGCGAYIMCELLDDATGAVLSGFSRKEFEPVGPKLLFFILWLCTKRERGQTLSVGPQIMDADGPALPLLWRGEGGEAAAPGQAAAAAARVRMRILFRDATIFALHIP